jgi:hypothetical protein
MFEHGVLPFADIPQMTKDRRENAGAGDFRQFLESDFVPTDGTRLPIVRSGDFGPSPFFGQLSGKPIACVFEHYADFTRLSLVKNVRFGSKAEMCNALSDVR